MPGKVTRRPGWSADLTDRMNEKGQQVNSRDALIVALPASASASAEGDGWSADAGHWWRVIDGQVTQSGDRLGWLHPSQGGPLPAETSVMAIAPAADVALHRAAFPRLAPKQAAVAARMLVAEQSIAAASELHVAMGEADSDTGTSALAAVDSRLMGQWIGWAARHGLNPDHIVPAALLLPLPRQDEGAGDELLRAVIGSETIVRGTDAAFVADPVLIRHIVGSEGSVRDIGSDAIERSMLAALDEPPVDLRSGAWAKQPARLFDTALLRRAALLVAAILLVSLLIMVARIIRVHADTAALDNRAAADVASVLASPPTIEAATAQLDARLGALGGGSARLSAPFAALVSAMEPATTVAIDALSWRADGTLSVTLAAPRAEDINVVLLALQARGYTVTATPRSGADGRALGDITIRSAP